MQLQYGDIIQFKPTTIYGKAIKVVDGSPYSHTGMFLKYEEGIPLFIESHKKKGGVVISKLHEWGNYDVYRPINIEPRPLVDMLNKLGRPYDSSMIIDIFITKTFKGKKYNNDDLSFICSELIDYAYHYKVGGGYVATPKTFADSPLFVLL